MSISRNVAIRYKQILGLMCATVLFLSYDAFAIWNVTKVTVGGDRYNGNRKLNITIEKSGYHGPFNVVLKTTQNSAVPINDNLGNFGARVFSGTENIVIDLEADDKIESYILMGSIPMFQPLNFEVVITDLETNTSKPAFPISLGKTISTYDGTLSYYGGDCFAARYGALAVKIWKNNNWVVLDETTHTVGGNTYSISREWQYLQGNSWITIAGSTGGTIFNRPTNVLHRCLVTFTKNGSSSTTDTIGGQIFQHALLDFENDTYVNDYTRTLNVEFNSTGGDWVYFYQVRPSLPQINPYGMDVTWGDIRGNGGFILNNLANGVHEYHIYTSLKNCERRIKFTMNPNGTVSNYRVVEWGDMSKVSFDIVSNTGAEAIITATNSTDDVIFVNQINIYDVAGQLVKTIPVNREISEFTEIPIDIQELVRGAYFANILGSDGSFIGGICKFIK